ncbi:tripartite tricarboxylate transporter TctB family protein [Lentibacter algarum]|uniref:tripartite tricarboxylate transporter TctB family protein n=1 Tax=Lentibacter algarum TaxID=576131 RepID=UPI001C08DD2C|nr:tripartite tricarboxylate transporter TctB family protein [Lentibacter algarum]MBU2983009.1 tripartite tricarboxylate transporter TctB family protein [Lentibacter algarum]
MSKDRSEEIKRFDGPLRGQALFAIVFFLAAALLLSQLGSETKWAKGTKFFAQPRFWPAVSVIGMLLFGGLHLWKLPRRSLTRVDAAEWLVWAKALEYVAWFMGYVWLVPRLGYLPMTVLFMLGLAYRLGYRSRKMLWISAIFGVVVVVVFKGLLNVKIPGGAVYEYLPGALRSFFILNF